MKDHTSKIHTICYMMTSLDGRIDCPMTEKLNGVESYYPFLDELNVEATVNGKVTAKEEIALKGVFEGSDNTPIGVVTYKLNKKCKRYDIIVDSKGELLWPDQKGNDNSYLILTSINAKREYLKYLDSLGISYICAGENKVDLVKCHEILSDVFEIKRMAICGGAIINTAYLEAGLLDEVIVIIGAGIDGRSGYYTSFEGRNSDVYPLTLIECRVLNNAVMLRYSTR